MLEGKREDLDIPYARHTLNQFIENYSEDLDPEAVISELEDIFEPLDTSYQEGLLEDLSNAKDKQQTLEENLENILSFLNQYLIPESNLKDIQDDIETSVTKNHNKSAIFYPLQNYVKGIFERERLVIGGYIVSLLLIVILWLQLKLGDIPTLALIILTSIQAYASIFRD